jgi:hypothetical protein
VSARGGGTAWTRRQAVVIVGAAGIVGMPMARARPRWTVQRLPLPTPWARLAAAADGGWLGIDRGGRVWRLPPGAAATPLGDGLDPQGPLVASQGRVAARRRDGRLWVGGGAHDGGVSDQPLAPAAGLLVLPLAVIGVTGDGMSARVVRLEPVGDRRWGVVATSPEPVLPDARPIQVDLERRGDGGHIVVLAGPDRTRVPHAVLGDDVEATRVLWLERQGLEPLRRLDLPAPYVLEDIAPRAWRADDGHPGLLSVRSGPDGGGLVLIEADPADRRALRIAAEGPPIGTRMRWLSPSTDGRRIVAVHTPHIGGVLHVYRRAGGRLEPQRRADGVSNHRLGARELDVSAWLGERLLLPSQEGGMLQVFGGADLRRAEDVRLPGRPLQMVVEHGAIAAACLLADGSVVRIVPPT